MNPQQEEQQQGSEPTLANAAKIIAAIDAGDHGWWIGDHFIEVRNTLSALAAQVARLKAIVDKLPTTADAVPIVPGMRLFLVDQMQYATVDAVSDNPSWPASATQDDGAVRSPFRSYWFSTREAAAASPANPVTQQESE